MKLVILVAVGLGLAGCSKHVIERTALNPAIVSAEAPLGDFKSDDDLVPGNEVLGKVIRDIILGNAWGYKDVVFGACEYLVAANLSEGTAGVIAEQIIRRNLLRRDEFPNNMRREFDKTVWEYSILKEGIVKILRDCRALLDRRDIDF
jgi:hypothetical protein